MDLSDRDLPLQLLYPPCHFASFMRCFQPLVLLLRLQVASVRHLPNGFISPLMP
jgi:hypothetical protein